MGSHMRSIEPWLPPWPLNQSVNETLSSFRMSLMPPSGSISARTIGDVPNARLLATLSGMDSCGVVKNAFKPVGRALEFQAVTPRQHYQSSLRVPRDTPHDVDNHTYIVTCMT